MATASILDSICDEIWIEIFRYLSPNDFLRVRLVCKYWASLSTDIRLKDKLCLKLDGPTILNYMTESETNYLPLHNINVLSVGKYLQVILATVAPNLRCLKLTNSPIFMLLANMNLPNLKELHLDFAEFHHLFTENDELRFLTGYNLTSLYVKCQEGLKPFGVAVQEMILASNSMLQCFHVSFYWDKEDIFLRCLEKYASTLKELDVYFVFQALKNKPLSKKWLKTLRNLKNLNILRLSGEFPTHLLECIFQNLAETTPLHHIELDGVILTDELLMYFLNKWCKSIYHLSIYNSKKITNKGLAEIHKLHNNLKSFSLRNCDFIDLAAILSAVASQTNYTLSELRVQSENDVSKELISELVEKLPNLKVLDLNIDCSPFNDLVKTYICRHQERYDLFYGVCYFDKNQLLWRFGMSDYIVRNWSMSYLISIIHKLLSFKRPSELKKENVLYFVISKLRICKVEDIPIEVVDSFMKEHKKLEFVYIYQSRDFSPIPDVVSFIFDNLKLLRRLIIENKRNNENSNITIYRNSEDMLTFHGGLL